ncbi:hypothetical protein GLAREA_03833 [Glarea lozoyensis ATCC 20868]|uniref:Uncharacterized protein n=1 Tax=Glarea lozoyensis (strain ATCC 20868 / MF5171) TaxID=1116229 RepID=S3DFW0_GLAL2|nr:uncharacterized protein GLAREA_03833 [Glarea lozoyensis ATCC 20868]EPE30866.1 hypothetical protein GLAREA_03833 [Glarea lozoyensis ATCC 20868]
MATTSTLSSHDISILSKIADPESSPSSPLLLDPSLPNDPHHNAEEYQKVAKSEVSIMSKIMKLEFQLADPKSLPSTETELLVQYQSVISELDNLISEHPKYASARNNRVQALRRLYGDAIFIQRTENTISSNEPQPLLKNADQTTLTKISTTILTDLSTGISLLTPAPFSALSPKAAKTLSLLYTQRGALYHHTAKQLNSNPSAELALESKEVSWSAADFEEAAARDFMMGGRYGNEVAKALAVSVNPTAKLCGDIVRDAMRRELSGTSDS